MEPCAEGALAPVRRVLLHSLQFLPANTVLHEFREDRFDFRDHAGIMNAPPEDLQVSCVPAGNPPKEQSLARIVEHSTFGNADLFKYLVGKPAKTQHVDIQDPLMRRFRDDLLLGLHGILVRDDNDIVVPGMYSLLQRSFRLFEDPIVKRAALSGSGSAEAKPVAHTALHSCSTDYNRLQLQKMQ